MTGAGVPPARPPPARGSRGSGGPAAGAGVRHAAARGAAIVATPIAPARFSASHRSSAVFTCDRTLSETLTGGNAFTYTAILPRRSTSGEIVPAGFGNRQAIADEHHRRFHRSVQLASRAERGVLADDERHFLAVAHERETRLIRHEQPAVELHRLPESRRAGRLEANRPKLALDVLDGFVEARRPDVPALELVVGEKLDVRPPALPFGREIRGLRNRAGNRRGQKASGQKRGFHGAVILPSRSMPPFTDRNDRSVVGRSANDDVR